MFYCHTDKLEGGVEGIHMTQNDIAMKGLTCQMWYKAMLPNVASELLKKIRFLDKHHF